MRKILIMGLPGAGKTALATALQPLLNAVVFNANSRYRYLGEAGFCLLAAAAFAAWQERAQRVTR